MRLLYPSMVGQQNAPFCTFFLIQCQYEQKEGGEAEASLFAERRHVFYMLGQHVFYIFLSKT